MTLTVAGSITGIADIQFACILSIDRVTIASSAKGAYGACGGEQTIMLSGEKS